MYEAQYLEKYEIRKNKRAREENTEIASAKNTVPELHSLRGKLVD